MATLNLVGDFPNPWSNPVEESKAIEAWKWAPGTDTWRAVCGAESTTVGRLSQFLGIIEKQKRGSINRINLLSHGNPGLIAFSGSIAKATGDVSLDVTKGLDLRIRDAESTPTGNGRLQESLGGIAVRLRDRFDKNAQIVLYLCNSGTDMELLQAIANAFGVVASGFSSAIYFCPEWPKILGVPPRINRSFTSLDKCKTKQAGFLHLSPTISRPPAAATGR